MVCQCPENSAFYSCPSCAVVNHLAQVQLTPRSIPASCFLLFRRSPVEKLCAECTACSCTQQMHAEEVDACLKAKQAANCFIPPRPSSLLLTRYCHCVLAIFNKWLSQLMPRRSSAHSSSGLFLISASSKASASISFPLHPRLPAKSCPVFMLHGFVVFFAV